MAVILGIDLGAEDVKLVELHDDGTIGFCGQRSHGKAPHQALLELLAPINLAQVRAVGVTGRLARSVRGHRVPTKSALVRGIHMIRPETRELTALSVGAHGFLMIEMHASGEEYFLQNSRCSQGTGNFLSQLVQRLGFDIGEASRICADEPHPAPLSGRCPVILKTDMTHLANKGENLVRVLAGLYDAVTENVLTLMRPRLAPKDVVLLGGVVRAPRIRRKLTEQLESKGFRVLPANELDSFTEALGAASFASEQSIHSDNPVTLAHAKDLLTEEKTTDLEHVSALNRYLPCVHRLPAPPTDPQSLSQASNLVLGFDIGSTGSKMGAIDATTKKVVWQHYRNTEGRPVDAAQDLLARFVKANVGKGAILKFAVTGSGREIVGSLLRTCYGKANVFVQNEIAAHARGALECDPEVDTIFEIGGQDAKYIRLESGNVVDSALNEACSAGTGSFIAEQGEKLLPELAQSSIAERSKVLNDLAISASECVSLGQHCSVFMAEVIDEAITQGIEKSTIVAGLYDSIIQNYLNRVKGPRSIGRKIFCQGMPFASDALAAAVARQTGRDVIVPAFPGMTGAHGVAMLALDEISERDQSIDPNLFLEAKVRSKDTFICRSTQGCGGTGNKCRIDRLRTDVSGTEQSFLWGGSCSLYDKGLGRNKLPDLTPDPFQERDHLIDKIVATYTTVQNTGATITLSDEFSMSAIFPLFYVFFSLLGLRIRLLRKANSSHLRKGIESARVPYCAPMQLYHGVVFSLMEQPADFYFTPMIKELPRNPGETVTDLCPIVLAAPDLISSLLTKKEQAKILKPTIEFGPAGYDDDLFLACLADIAASVGTNHTVFEKAAEVAIACQKQFERDCVDLGRSALQFAKEHSLVTVVVLGRPYTIYNDILNSNVPSLLRTLGTLAIPVDCIPLDEAIPIFDKQYWVHTQRNLRVATWVRSQPAVYTVYCSNYSCGPDSFTLHFYGYEMSGTPYAVIETDGHSGDAGTKTRLEAFLYCVDTDMRAHKTRSVNSRFNALERESVSMRETVSQKRTMLLPRMGPQAEVAAAALRADGFVAESLPLTQRDDVRVGRQYTSGKECVPMTLTLGAMLNRLMREEDHATQFTYFMPTARGPCRFGVYNSLHKIALERAGYGDRVKVVSPDESNYFREMSPDFSARLWVGFLAHDLLNAMRHDVVPVESIAGAGKQIHEKYWRELISLMESVKPGSGAKAIGELMTGNLWGIRALIERAATDFAAVKSSTRDAPSVAVVGEIYVRLDPFANDFVIEKLEERGLRVRHAPFVEWLEYTTHLGEQRVLSNRLIPGDEPLTLALTGLIQRVTSEFLYQGCAKRLGWAKRLTIEEILATSRAYVHKDLTGEAALTLGGPIHEYNHGQISGVVIVGPHECMPCKIAEAQYGKVAEELGIPFISIAVNGDPIDTEMLDRFAFDLHRKHEGDDEIEQRAIRRVRLPVVKPTDHILQPD